MCECTPFAYLCWVDTIQHQQKKSYYNLLNKHNILCVCVCMCDYRQMETISIWFWRHSFIHIYGMAILSNTLNECTINNNVGNNCCSSVNDWKYHNMIAMFRCQPRKKKKKNFVQTKIRMYIPSMSTCLTCIYTRSNIAIVDVVEILYHQIVYRVKVIWMKARRN